MILKHLFIENVKYNFSTQIRFDKKKGERRCIMCASYSTKMRSFYKTEYIKNTFSPILCTKKIFYNFKEENYYRGQLTREPEGISHLRFSHKILINIVKKLSL